MSLLPFENLKARAKRALDTRIARCDPLLHGIGIGIGIGIDFDSEAACLALIRCAVLDDDERAALRATARSARDGSDLAQRARMHAEANRSDWSQWLQRIRQTGHHRIDQWDVRCVRGLIAYFPECVGQRQRRAAIACHVDDETDAWMLAFADAPRRAEIEP